ncbi:tumor necrosis factor receptor superfamily member 21 [Patella vulgata]|uniref:tumor necrosis factor receptor superfamily member 21 n=1 Tax=Patella vulgata TaxID=6465 RepID=UPI0021803585|nr:tumor necrosis factor receptor superfamily member 21 [Patella vulgata]XP_050412444.1 tumor necrosis factor receptor superfamily member 21 [Patella vulgata]XP_050412445.1 tumor necrosis factor receptor superfamily member 21 [Patella vulgata]XP_050412447.1 tumor necrosis factor receptor superfamily member 21 [Patella vulgata]XP_050412448.1 tumor necrosis factor receptor superfamily member 21 [Patella vulgata]XP_050412449.1 tumor necrosis factor receptor superfamily member 21 [Patella vulgata]
MLINKAVLPFITTLYLTTGYPSEKGELYQSEEGLWCRLCLPGTYLKASCTENYGLSTCETCSSGTFSNRSNSATQCQDCAVCPLSTITEKSCTHFSDVVCVCSEGKMWIPLNNGHDGRCIDERFKYVSPNGLTCQMCPEGTHLNSPCSIQHGTSTCTTCPPLTFSSKPNQALYCASCTICQRGQRETSPCSRTRDTICECPEGYFWQIIVEDQGICRPHSECKSGQLVIQPGTSTSDTVCSRKKDELVTPPPPPSSSPSSLMHQTATNENNNLMFQNDVDFTQSLTISRTLDAISKPTTEPKRHQNKSISNQSQEIWSKVTTRSTGRPIMEMVLTLAPPHPLATKDKKTLTRRKNQRFIKNEKKRKRCHNINKLSKIDKKRCRYSKRTRKHGRKRNRKHGRKRTGKHGRKQGLKRTKEHGRKRTRKHGRKQIASKAKPSSQYEMSTKKDLQYTVSPKRLAEHNNHKSKQRSKNRRKISRRKIKRNQTKRNISIISPY